jgi:hypothetical protein
MYSRTSASIIRSASRCLTARVAREGLAETLATASLSVAQHALSSSVLGPLSILAPRKKHGEESCPPRCLVGSYPFWIVPSG